MEDKHKLRERSLQRVRHLLGALEKDEVEEECLLELDVYGLGQVRSLSEFQAHTGVNFKEKQIQEKVRPPPRLHVDDVLPDDEQARWGGLPATVFVEGMAQFALAFAGLKLN